MSHPELFDHLMKVGTGWIGWTEDQTLDTSMPGIALAHEGRVDMLRAIFGGDKPDPPKPEPPKQPDHNTVADKIRAAFAFLKGKR